MATERKTQTAVERAQEAAQSSTERASRMAQDTAESIGEYSTRAKEQLRETGESLKQTTRAAGERSREIMDQVSDYIAEHPMTAIGIAVAVGFALGAMVGRGDSDNT